MDKHGGNTYANNIIEYDFSVSLSPLGMPEQVKSAIKEFVDVGENYPDINQRKIKEAIASFYGVSTRWIVCGNGAADLIYRLPLAVKSLLSDEVEENRKPKALILEPGFSEYERALEQFGFDIEFHIPWENRDGLKWQVGSEAFHPGGEFLESITKGNYDLIVAANPGNPIGTLLEGEYIHSLIERSNVAGSYLMIDECFLELTGRDDELSSRRFLDTYYNLIVLRSFTKTFAMAGVRLGYLMCSNKELVKALEDVTQPWPLSALSEIGGIEALNEEQGVGKAYIEEANQILREERKRLFKGLKALGLKPIEPKANYIFFFGPKGLKEKLMEKGFLIRDCSNFRGLFEGCYRIGIKGPEENQKILEAMEDVL